MLLVSTDNQADSHDHECDRSDQVLAIHQHSNRRQHDKREPKQHTGTSLTGIVSGDVFPRGCDDVLRGGEGLGAGYGRLYKLAPGIQPDAGTAVLDLGHCVIRLDVQP